MGFEVYTWSYDIVVKSLSYNGVWSAKNWFLLLEIGIQCIINWIVGRNVFSGIMWHEKKKVFVIKVHNSRLENVTEQLKIWNFFIRTTTHYPCFITRILRFLNDVKWEFQSFKVNMTSFGCFFQVNVCTLSCKILATLF